MLQLLYCADCRFSSRVSLYFTVFIWYSTLTSLLWPAAEKHPHSTAGFTEGMVHLCQLTNNTGLEWCPKSLFLVSSDHISVFLVSVCRGLLFTTPPQSCYWWTTQATFVECTVSLLSHETLQLLPNLTLGDLNHKYHTHTDSALRPLLDRCTALQYSFNFNYVCCHHDPKTDHSKLWGTVRALVLKFLISFAWSFFLFFLIILLQVFKKILIWSMQSVQTSYLLILSSIQPRQLNPTFILNQLLGCLDHLSYKW